MLPDNPQSQISDPATLPPVQNGVPSVPAPLPVSPSAPAASQPAALDVTARARQLVEQYQNNPYQLSMGLQQLKSQYLAEQFHISANPSQK